MAERRTATAGGVGGGATVTHLVMAQTVDGIPVVGADVTANVTGGGRLLSVGGAPAPDLALRCSPRLDARAALHAARRDVNDGRRAPASVSTSASITRDALFPGGDRGALVAWAGDGGARLAWRVLFTDRTSTMYDTIVDAATGFRRRSLSAPGAPAPPTAQAGRSH